MSEKRKYTLNELVAQCDPDAPMPLEVQEWEQAESVGLERAFMVDPVDNFPHSVN